MADSGLFWAATLLLLLLGQTSASCPQPCRCYGGMMDCVKKGLTDIPDLPEWVEDLDLSRNQGLKLREGAFRNLPNLKKLYLEDMGLERLPPLGKLNSLQALYLSSNRIKKVEHVSLAGMPWLQELDLSRNKLTTFTSEPFANHTLRLKRLNLSRNQISYLKNEPFKYFGTLEDLKLSRNHLDSTTFNRAAGIFNNLTNLRALDLNGNRITQLAGLMFDQLTNLTVLKLRRNEITTFSDGVFFGLNSIQNLLLDYNNITTIRKGLLFDMTSLSQLSISHNLIDSIHFDTWESTKHLKRLDLSDNRLVSLREGTFKWLRQLVELRLAKNHLTHIENGSFTSTPSLLSLDLSHNQLRWSVEDNSGAFNGLDKLRSLAISYNGIQTIHGEIFAPLQDITSLDLRGNQIRSLPHNPFLGLTRLNAVHLNTSSLVCDCHLAWLPGWMAAVSFNTSAMVASCSYPEALQERSVVSITAADLTCTTSPRPIIKKSPTDQIALQGTNVTLACVAEYGSDGDLPKFMWRKNDQLLVDRRQETHVSVIGGDGEGGTKHNLTSLLHLQNVSDEDTGDYQCVVRNDFGASYSERATIGVYIFPYFTNNPSNIEVRIGEVARIECSADGTQPIEISLVKEGKNFPAALERRMHVVLGEPIFFIKPVKAEDEGQYSCKAQNVAGTAYSDVSLTVRQTPQFTNPLQDRVARLGDNAVLECQGTGKPAPNLTWSKDGRVLQENDHHYIMVHDAQYLLILNSRMEDAGTYVCELTNILGKVRGQVNLSIRRDITTTSTTTGIVIMAVVCCVVITSLVWVVIIYQTRKRAQTGALGPPPSYPKEEGLGRYPGHLPHHHHHHHLPPDLVHTFTPLLAGAREAYASAGQDSGSEHSSGKDSGTGDSAQRSSEDLLPLELSRPGLRRSLIICADGSPSVIRGVSAVNVGPNGEFLGCEDTLGRPRLSTFSPHLSPSAYSPSLYTASLRRGSHSRRNPTCSPVSPSASLPRGHHLNHTEYHVPQAVMSPGSIRSPEGEAHVHYASRVPPPTRPDEEVECGGDNNMEELTSEFLPVNYESESGSLRPLRTVVCSDGRSEVNIRRDNLSPNRNSIPSAAIESR